jgi:hypothetical protein
MPICGARGGGHERGTSCSRSAGEDILYGLDRFAPDRACTSIITMPGQYLLNGCMATSGSVKWFAGICAGPRRATEACAAHDEAAAVPAGSDGL